MTVSSKTCHAIPSRLLCSLLLFSLPPSSHCLGLLHLNRPNSLTNHPVQLILLSRMELSVSIFTRIHIALINPSFLVCSLMQMVMSVSNAPDFLSHLSHPIPSKCRAIVQTDNLSRAFHVTLMSALNSTFTVQSSRISFIPPRKTRFPRRLIQDFRRI